MDPNLQNRLEVARRGWSRFWEQDQNRWKEWFRTNSLMQQQDNDRWELASNTMKALKESSAGDKVKCVASMLLRAEVLKAVRVVVQTDTDQAFRHFTNDRRGIKFSVGCFLSRWKIIEIIDKDLFETLVVELEERRAALSNSPADLSAGIQKPLRELLTTAGIEPEGFNWSNCLAQGARWEVRLERDKRLLSREQDGTVALVELTDADADAAAENLHYVADRQTAAADCFLCSPSAAPCADRGRPQSLSPMEFIDWELDAVRGVAPQTAEALLPPPSPLRIGGRIVEPLNPEWNAGIDARGVVDVQLYRAAWAAALARIRGDSDAQ